MAGDGNADCVKFWSLIEQSARMAKAKESRISWIQERLADSAVDEIVDFQKCLWLARGKATNWDLYGAFANLFEIESSDSFTYFIHWLIGLGRRPFGAVTEHPDALMELPEMLCALSLAENSALGLEEFSMSMEAAPRFERLAYVAFDPYLEVTGLGVDSLGDAVEARGVSHPGSVLRGEEWDYGDFNEVKQRLPLIARYCEQRRRY